MEVLPISPKTTEPGSQPPNDDITVRKAKKLPRPSILFIVVVLLPLVASIIYFGFLASDIYISESQFVVRSPQKPSTSPLGAILQTAGFTNANDEGDAAQSFAISRDALRALNKDGAFEKAYTRPGISIIDRFNPLGFQRGLEYLYRYFREMVSLNQDSSTSTFQLSVRAFTPEDAYRINQQLLDLTEATVNRLNERGQQDLVRYAQAEVDLAKARSEAAAVALAAYRNRSGVVDPQMQAQAKMQMISNLQNQLITSKTELAQVEHYAPENPRIPVIRTEIGTIEQQIQQQMSEVAGSSRSLAGNAVQYQRLTLENDFADKQLAASLASLEQAKDDARRKQAYVERIVQPNLPDAPMEPRRLRGILATLVVSFIAFGILRMLLAGVKEHAQ